MNKDAETPLWVYFDQYSFFWSQGLLHSAHLTAFDMSSINKCWHWGWLLSLYKLGLVRHWLIPSFFLSELLLFLSGLLLLSFICSIQCTKNRGLENLTLRRCTVLLSSSKSCKKNVMKINISDVHLSNVCAIIPKLAPSYFHFSIDKPRTFGLDCCFLKWPAHAVTNSTPPKKQYKEGNVHWEQFPQRPHRMATHYSSWTKCADTLKRIITRQGSPSPRNQFPGWVI